MKISSAFKSNFLRADDLRGRTVKVKIERVVMEDVGGAEHKPCVYFENRQKALVLNRVNADSLAETLGDETDGWVGQQIEIFTDKTHFQGRLVPCLRVRLPEPPPPADTEGGEGFW